MQIYFTGAGGQVGRALAALDPQAVGWSRENLNLAGGQVDIRPLFSTPPPPNSLILNLAAFTAVDAAEEDSQATEVRKVNELAPGLIAQQAQELGIPMIQVSTDYVFGGRRKIGECNAPTDPTSPCNEYGRSKLAGEQAALAHGAHVVRTSWVYTGPRNAGKDFVRTMHELAERGVDPAVVDDQWGRPTYAAHLAAGLIELAQALVGEYPRVAAAEIAPIVHCAGSGEAITWKELARATFAAGGHDPQRVRGIPTSEYPTAATRPLNSTLCIDEWQASGLTPLPAWQDGLAQAMQ